MYALVDMPLAEIFKAVKLMDEPAEVLWESLVNEFGHEFFLPVVDKNYGHLFVNDLSRHAQNIQAAISDALENERLITEQCEAQLK